MQYTCIFFAPVNRGAPNVELSRSVADLVIILLPSRALYAYKILLLICVLFQKKVSFQIFH